MTFPPIDPVPIPPDTTPTDPGPIDPVPVPAGPVQTLPGGVTTITVPAPPLYNLELLSQQARANPLIAAAGFWSLNVVSDGTTAPQLVLGVTGSTAGLDLLAAFNQVIAAHNAADQTPGQARDQMEAEAAARLEAQAAAYAIDDPVQAILDILITLGYGTGENT